MGELPALCAPLVQYCGSHGFGDTVKYRALSWVCTSSYATSIHVDATSTWWNHAACNRALLPAPPSARRDAIDENPSPAGVEFPVRAS